MSNASETHTYTLITGASTGLGKALASECAARKMNLILIALPDDGLEEVAREITERFSVKVRMYELDLTNNGDFSHLIETLKYLSINCLINNVGIGGTMHFSKTPAEFLHRIINLNIRITSMLTYHLLSQLQAHRKSHIINISSIISQYPAAFKTLYPASKSFIYSFSLGLREELRNSPVCVSVALPGPMDTNPDVHKRLMEKQGKFAKASMLTPASVARKIMEQALQNKGLIIPGALNKLCWYLMKIIPWELGVPYLSKIISREILPVRNANTSQKYKPVEQEH